MIYSGLGAAVIIPRPAEEKQRCGEIFSGNRSQGEPIVLDLNQSCDALAVDKAGRIRQAVRVTYCYRHRWSDHIARGRGLKVGGHHQALSIVVCLERYTEGKLSLGQVAVQYGYIQAKVIFGPQLQGLNQRGGLIV